MGRIDKMKVSKIDAYLDYLERHGRKFDEWLENAGVINEDGAETGEALVGIIGIAGPVLLAGIMIGVAGTVLAVGLRR